MWKLLPGTAIGLSLGHVFYQMLMTEPNFAVAAERSFFQVTGIICFIVVCKLTLPKS